MPDDQGKLSQEELDKIAAWLNKQAPREKAPCTVCGTNDWAILEHLVSPPTFGKGHILGGASYVFAMLFCSNCGHTVFINATKAGITRSSAEMEKEREEKAKTKPDKKKGK